MRQLCRDRRGRVRIVEVPAPVAREGEQLIQVSHALLAPQTEVRPKLARGRIERTLEAAREITGYLKQAGVGNTVAFLRAAWADLRPTGFSACGHLMGKDGGPEVSVMCAGHGLGAHAEYLVACHSQMTPLPPGTMTRAGALAALGAGALIAFDRLGVPAGGRVIVAGLGIWGQMAVLTGAHSGYEVVAVDPRAERLAWAKAHGAKEAVPSTALPALLREDVGSACGVLLAAGSSLPLPVPSGRLLQLDAELLADKEALQRSLRRFADHLARGWTPEEELGLPIFRLDDAAAVQEPALLAVAHREEARTRLGPRPGPSPTGGIPVGLVGCGTFAKLHHLPNLAGAPAFRLVAVASRSPVNAMVVARRFGAAYCTTDAAQLFRDPAITLVFLTGRHDEHVPLLLDLARLGKRAFVEKPVAITAEGCALLERHAGGMWGSVGFNRRFAPLVEESKARLAGRRGPAFVNYRVNFGAPVANWFRDPAQGGGRLIGAACHYVDLATWLLETRPVRVFAEPVGTAIPGAPEEQDTAVALVRYADGSVLSLSFSSLGSRECGPKEELEAHWDGSVLRLTDFHSLVVNGRMRRLLRRDMGERRQLAALAQAFRADDPPPVPLSHGIAATRLTLRMIEALRAGAAVQVRDLEA